MLLVAVSDARATRDRPPPAHTGGFGEPTCHACHFMAEPNSGPGTLAILDVPSHVTPGTQYRLAVELLHPDVAAAGFQLAIRFADGRQAGSLEVAAEDARRIDITVQGGIAYAHQLEAGSSPVEAGRALWHVSWTAPEEVGPVHFHVAANAGDADSSPLGDFVYTAVAKLPSH